MPSLRYHRRQVQALPIGYQVNRRRFSNTTKLSSPILRGNTKLVPTRLSTEEGNIYGYSSYCRHDVQLLSITVFDRKELANAHKRRAEFQRLPR